MSIIEIRDLKKTYTNGSVNNEVLKGLNLTINDNEIVVVLGKSGSGKSTLLNIIGGLESYDSGEVKVLGEKLREKNEKKLAEYRRNTIGFVFQSFQLIPVLSVWENVVMPLRLDKKSIDKEYVMDILKTLEISDKCTELPSKLSGGQQQRVAIARALVNKPSIILADEPTGNLDSDNGNHVMELMIDSVKKYGKSMLVITHDKDLTKMATRVLVLKDGKIVQNK